MKTYKKVYFGKNNDGERIYLSGPSWDCDWYWGFGYLGNTNCHYHLSGYANGRNINIFDALRSDYELTEVLNDDATLWTFCELVQTAYSLIKSAEVLGRGSSHITTNPAAARVINPLEAERINKYALPAVFDAIECLFSDANKKAIKAKKKAASDKKIQAAKDKKNAENDEHEIEVLQWLTDNDVETDNVIYYSHKDLWSFGWRGPLSQAYKNKFLEVCDNVGFPGNYEIKEKAN